MSDTVDPELKKEVDELYKSLTAEWHDIPICVILTGKIECLLNQTIVADIIESTNYNKEKIDVKFRLLWTKGNRKQKNSKDTLVKLIKCLIDVTAEVPKHGLEVEMPDDVKTRTTLDQSDSEVEFSWFENEDCGKIAENGLDLPRTREEAVNALETQCRGLIHEVISVMTENKYSQLLKIVPDQILNGIGDEELDAHRKIRNAVVHRRTSHCFQGEKERKLFIETYADIVSCCVVDNDCFLLASNEEKKKKRTEYMKPKAHYNLVHEMILNYNKAIEENRKTMKETMDKDKRREIEEATNELRKQRNGALIKYQDLLEDVKDAQEGVEEMKKQAKEELERIQNDGNRESIKKVVLVLEDIGKLVGKIGEEREEPQHTVDTEEIPESEDEASPEEEEVSIDRPVEEQEPVRDTAQEGLGDENLEGGGGAEGEGEDTIDQQVGESMSRSNATPTKDQNETQSETTIPKAGKRKRQNQKEKEKKKQEKAAEEAAAATAVDATAVDATAVAEENSNVQPDEE